jgi:uridine kinase
VAEALSGCVFSLDSYYRDLSHLPLYERRQTNFDHPDSLDSELLARDLRALSAGKQITRPVYDFATHCRSKETEQVQPASVIVVEGIFTLNYPAVRDVFDTRIFVAAGHDACFERRLKRDLAERGYTEAYIRRLYDTCVRPMTDQFLNPTKLYADVVVDGTQSVEESVARILRHVGNSVAVKR